MGKLKVSKTSKKPEASSPKVLPTSPESAPPSSQPESISVTPSSEFQKDIEKSKADILAAETETKGKRGRKALPRDAAGNIIRDAAPPSGGGAQPLALNPKTVEDNKAFIKGLAIPVANMVAVEYALKDLRAKCPEELEEPIVVSGGEILTELCGDAVGRWGKYVTLISCGFMWFAAVKNIRAENIEKIKKENEVKAGIPSDNVRPN